MATPTTLALAPRGDCAQPRTAVPRDGRLARLQALWRRLFTRREGDAHATAEVGYESLAGLDGRLLADIGAPEPLQDRARRRHDLRQQRLIELERGYRTLGWRW